MLADLRNARVASDAERFRRAAHSLKSNANTFGAMKLASAARAVELNGIDADAARAEAAIAALETEHARVAVALRALSNG